MGPLIVGFRRLEEEKAQREDPLPVKAQARRNVRTAIFAANRAVWISCCEACLYLRTGSSAVLSHRDQVVHGRKGLFMMHECKRILNGEVGGAGLWEVQLGTTSETPVGDCVQVQEAEHETSEDEEAAADGDDPAESDAAEEHDEEENIEDKEHAAEEQDDEENMEDTEHGVEVSATEHAKEEKQERVQIFRAGISLRDNWLHRGDALQDMDIHTYAEHVYHIEKPAAGSRPDQDGGEHLFPFDAHYQLASRYIQVLRTGPKRHVARFTLPSCKRENVNEGEDNAQFKSFHCSLLRCKGPGQCADPLMCASTLFTDKTGKRGFVASWRARESEILTLARRGHCKKERARRLETIFDTSLCKVRNAEAAGSARDHEGELAPDSNRALRLVQVDLQRLFRQRIRCLREQASAENPCNYGYPERLADSILKFAGESRRDDVLKLTGGAATA